MKRGWLALLVAGGSLADAQPAASPPLEPPPEPAAPPEPALEPERDVTFTRGSGLRLDLEASSVIKVSGAQPVDSANLTQIRGHFSLNWGGPRIRYYAALDLALGGSVADLGLAFDIQFLPIGLALQLRRPESTALIAVATGIGVSGAPPALPVAGVIPLQMVSVFRLSEKLNLIVRGRAAWLTNRTSRDKGAPSAAFADELDGIAALQLSRLNYLDGYYLGVAYRELQDARFVGVVFGSGGGEEVTQE